MKYMILVHGSHRDYEAMSGKASDGKPAWSTEDMQAMFAHMNTLNEELQRTGEWVDGQGLTDPAHARRVQFRDGAPVVTDGPYPETKEVIAGFWVVDCESLDRATEIAARAAACPGPGGVVGGDFVDIRPIDQGPAEGDA